MSTLPGENRDLVKRETEVTEGSTVEVEKDQEESTEIVCQKWEETESGWGVRPDGYSLHLSEEDRKEFVKQYWASMPAGPAPDEYSRESGSAYTCKGGPSLTKALRKAKEDGHPGLRFFSNTYPGDGGKDGWVNKK